MLGALPSESNCCDRLSMPAVPAAIQCSLKKRTAGNATSKQYLGPSGTAMPYILAVLQAVSMRMQQACVV